MRVPVTNALRAVANASFDVSRANGIRLITGIAANAVKYAEIRAFSAAIAASGLLTNAARSGFAASAVSCVTKIPVRNAGSNRALSEFSRFVRAVWQDRGIGGATWHVPD